MKLSDPRQVYVQILKQLSGKILTWEQAHNILEKKFNSNTKRPMTLLLVDELDLLCTKRQDVIYNLLDWPTKASARLVVITIANTMDLPERVLMGRITSRLGLTRVTFQPYNYKQLHEIVLTRLKNTDILKNDIIQLIARIR
ncbi:origin recognition complex subunit 1-like [Pogonomyrmex barbatus]|uniref:Origin recognition complex subunit 1 n=1 Tax=Pogonomyrmex barbatus TaxID=144034 RepID=A0A6I9VWD2_9HYME|nr:origin recognition complex subunit 1-like [Pogonomyrmex barbatus]